MNVPVLIAESFHLLSNVIQLTPKKQKTIESHIYNKLNSEIHPIKRVVTRFNVNILFWNLLIKK